jgi:hypothetical protein
MAVISVAMVIVVMIVADGRPHDFVTNKQSDRFPEVPEAALSRLAGTHSLRKSAEDDQTDHEGDQLQHHELGDLKPGYFRQRDMISPRQLEKAEVAYVMK